MVRALNSRAGLTVAELIIAAGIIAIGIISLAVLFIRGLQLQRKSAALVQSAQVASQLLNRLRDLPPEEHPSAASFVFDGRTPTPTVAGYPPPPYPSVELDNTVYAVRLEVTPHPDGVRKARVQVFSNQTTFVSETLLLP